MSKLEDLKPYSMKATFITHALESSASLEDVQAAAGHADPSTTKLYDRRGRHPARAATLADCARRPGS
jgi:integrase/recombinase XerD